MSQPAWNGPCRFSRCAGQGRSVCIGAGLGQGRLALPAQRTPLAGWGRQHRGSCPFLSLASKGSPNPTPSLTLTLNHNHNSSIQFSSVAQSCPTLCGPMNLSTPGLPVHHHLPEFTQTHVHQVGDAIQPSHPLSSPSPLPPVPPSIRVFSNESTLRMRWPKSWSFSFSISPSNEHPGLISFRMDWLDLLAVQVTLKSLLQHHSSKASILWRSAFSILQLSHPYMTTGKIIAWTRWAFVGLCF